MDFQLTAGEQVLWRGAPSQGIRLRAPDLILIPFILIWFGAISFAMGASGGASAAVPFDWLFWSFFLFIGLYLLVGRFVADMIVRSRTEYALTNRRAIIESGVFRRTTRSVNLAAAPEIRFREGRGGRGTIEFGGTSPFPFAYRGWPGWSQFMSPAFEGIEDARSVYQQVLDAQRQAQEGRTG
jgi:hypothetical protein